MPQNLFFPTYPAGSSFSAPPSLHYLLMTFIIGRLRKSTRPSLPQCDKPSPKTPSTSSLLSLITPQLHSRQQELFLLKKPNTSDISNYQLSSLLSFLFKSSNAPPTINCVAISHKTASKILTSLASKQHILLKLPLWQSLRSFIPLNQSNYHQYSSSLTFTQCLTQSNTTLSGPSL